VSTWTHLQGGRVLYTHAAAKASCDHAVISYSYALSLFLVFSTSGFLLHVVVYEPLVTPCEWLQQTGGYCFRLRCVSVFPWFRSRLLFVRRSVRPCPMYFKIDTSKVVSRWTVRGNY